MELWLSVEGVDPVAGLADLARWLRLEPELRGLIAPRPAPPKPGELGTGTDVLVAALGSGGLVTALAASLRVYLSQPRRSDVKITIEEPGGRKVKVDVKNVKDVERLVSSVLDREL